MREKRAGMTKWDRFIHSSLERRQARPRKIDGHGRGVTAPSGSPDGRSTPVLSLRLALKGSIASLSTFGNIHQCQTRNFRRLGPARSPRRDR
jgi:hypothetical protein